MIPANFKTKNPHCRRIKTPRARDEQNMKRNKCAKKKHKGLALNQKQI